MVSTSFTSKTLVLALLALLFAAAPTSVEAQPPCHICGDAGNEAMSFPHVILSNVGKSCNQIALDVAMGVPFGTTQCSASQNQWRGRCCSANRPSGSNPPTGLPAQNIPSVNYVGPNPPCKVCRDGDYPYASSMVINFLYIGEGSCAQYYKYGLEGRIEAHMCDPVKFFSYEPCGCGEFNPYFNKNHPLAQQAQQAPGTNTGSSSSTTSSTTSSSNGQSPQQQRQPEGNDGKNGVKMGGESYGGSGGMRRGLKGQRPQMAQHAPASTATVVDVVQA